MPLFVVLSHPRGRQKVKNVWRPDGRLVDAIVTSEEVATLCNVSLMAKDYVYIHRSPWGSAAAEITSRARVASVTRVGRDYKVDFISPEPWASRPPEMPLRGQDYYFDGPRQKRMPNG